LGKDSNANSLKKELGGDMVGYSDDPDYAGFCAKGDKCLRYRSDYSLEACHVEPGGEFTGCQPWTKGQVTCEGNHLDSQMKERCIMSYSDLDEHIKNGASKRTGFCQECKNFLKTVPQLDCSIDD
jgi:hypothetical protein